MNILIVDRDLAQSSYLADKLEEKGYWVQEAQDSEAAAAFAKATEFDVLVTRLGEWWTVGRYGRMSFVIVPSPPKVLDWVDKTVAVDQMTTL